VIIQDFVQDLYLKHVRLYIFVNVIKNRLKN
jgi:hypothetical protein